MRWHELIPPWIALVSEDAALLALLGGNYIFPAQASRPVKVPSIEYLMIGDREGESFGTITVQFDFWVRGIKPASLIENRLRTLLHYDVAFELNGERIWSRYVDSRTLEFPADPGVIHRSLDFEIESLRSKYVPQEES